MEHGWKWWGWKLVFSSQCGGIHGWGWGGDIRGGYTACHRIFSSFHVVGIKSTHTESWCGDVGRGGERASSASSPSSFEHSVSCYHRESGSTIFLNISTSRIIIENIVFHRCVDSRRNMSF